MSNEGIEGKPSRAEDKNERGSKQKRVRIGAVEFPRIAEEREERLAVGREISDKHVASEYQPCEARSQSCDQEHSAEELNATDKERSAAGRGNTKSCEELRNLRKVMQLAPACLHELPSPVKAHEKQKWRLSA